MIRVQPRIELCLQSSDEAATENQRARGCLACAEWYRLDYRLSTVIVQYYSLAGVHVAAAENPSPGTRLRRGAPSLCMQIDGLL